MSQIHSHMFETPCLVYLFLYSNIMEMILFGKYANIHAVFVYLMYVHNIHRVLFEKLYTRFVKKYLAMLYMSSILNLAGKF